MGGRRSSTPQRGLCEHATVEALIGTVGALIGAASALAATMYASSRQRASEYKKEVRLAVAELTRTLGDASHSIEWLAWKAQTPLPLNQKSIDDYNAEMHRALPKIIGDLAVVSALDRDAFLQMYEIVNELYLLDQEVAKRVVIFDSYPEESTVEVAQYSRRAADFAVRLAPRVADILREI